MEKITRRRIKCRIINVLYAALSAFVIFMYLTTALIGVKVSLNLDNSNKELIKTVVTKVLSEKQDDKTGSGDHSGESDPTPEQDPLAVVLLDEGNNNKPSFEDLFKDPNTIAKIIDGVNWDSMSAAFQNLGFELKGMDLIQITLAKDASEKYALVNEKVISANINAITGTLIPNIIKVVPSIVTAAASAALPALIDEALKDVELPDEVSAALGDIDISTPITNIIDTLMNTDEPATVEVFKETVAESMGSIISSISENIEDTSSLPDEVKTFLSAADLFSEDNYGDDGKLKEEVLNSDEYKEFTKMTDGLVDSLLPVLGVDPADSTATIDIAGLLNNLPALLGGLGGDTTGGDDSHQDPEPEPEARALAALVSYAGLTQLDETPSTDITTMVTNTIMGFVNGFISEEVISPYLGYVDYATYALAGLVGIWALFGIACLFAILRKKKPFVTTGLIWLILGTVQFVLGLVFILPDIVFAVAKIPAVGQLVDQYVPAQIVETTLFGIAPSSLLGIGTITIVSSLKFAFLALIAKGIISWFYKPARRKIKREMRKEKRAAARAARA